MKFIVEFDCDSVAFGQEPNDETYRNVEVMRILDKVKVAVELYRTEGPCLDINGNTVGSWRFANE